MCIKTAIAAIVLFAAAAPAFAQKTCDELKAEIAAKIEASGGKVYALDVADNDQVKGGKVVGSCSGGTKKIGYKKG